MKKFKKLKLMAVIGLGLILAYATNVFASGSASLTIEGNSTVALNENITVNLYVTDVNSNAGGVVSVGGTLKFDAEYLEYVSANATTDPYNFQYQAKNVSSGSLKIAGLDNSMEAGITSKTNVISVTFKAIKKGSTTLTFDNGELSDTEAILNGNFGSKTITIGNATTPDPGPSTQSSDATLKSLAVAGYTLSPAFDKNTTSYSVTVPADATSVSISADATDSKATVSGAGSTTLSGDKTTIAVVVTAEDGTQKTYNVTVNKEAAAAPKNSDATLSSLEVTGHTLDPEFDKDTTTYAMEVESDVDSINIKAIPTDSKATVNVVGNTLSEGVNAVKVKVTAEDGSEKIYTINVTKKAKSSGNGGTGTTTKKSSDNYLKELSTTSGDLSPAFSKTTSNYSITIPYDTDKLDLRAIANDSKAKVTITGNSNLKVGNNVIEIEVKAEDGSSRSYTINVTKSAQQSNNKLTDIILDGGDINIKFDPGKYEYNVELDPKTKSIDVKTLIGNTNAKVEVTGNENLKEGNNVILVKVTDENGFVQYYKINAYKQATNGVLLFGVDFPKWAIYGLILLIPFLLVLLILGKRKNEETKQAPAIEFKPEFNFSSKNGTDDDYVEAGGVLNQSSGVPLDHTQPIDINQIPGTNLGVTEGISTTEPKVLEYKEHTSEDIPYDPYDDVVTKDELIDAINEKDSKKLKILYEQEMLNREKEKVKEETETRSSRYNK